MDVATQFKPVRRGGLPSEEQAVCYRETAKRFKAAIRAPLILVGLWFLQPVKPVGEGEGLYRVPDRRQREKEKSRWRKARSSLRSIHTDLTSLRSGCTIAAPSI